MEGPPRQFACSEKDCPFSTKHQSDMAKHVRTHTGERPYACTDCEYRSSRRDQLAAHMRRHTGERPYACTFPACAYKSVTAGTLRAHKKSHNVDGLRCDAGGGGCGALLRAEVGASFSPLAGAVLDHMAAAHGGAGGAAFSCSEGDWAGPSPLALWAHRSSSHAASEGGAAAAAAEAPCRVPGCGYATARPASLAAHERAHARPNPGNHVRRKARAAADAGSEGVAALAVWPDAGAWAPGAPPQAQGAGLPPLLPEPLHAAAEAEAEVEGGAAAAAAAAVEIVAAAAAVAAAAVTAEALLPPPPPSAP